MCSQNSIIIIQSKGGVPMQTTNINIRTDKELKDNCEKLFESLGLNMSTAINIFLRQSLRAGGLPFEVKLDIPESKSSMNGKDIKKIVYKSDMVEETEQLKIYDISVEDIPFRIAFTKHSVNKRTIVHCSNGSIIFEERIPVTIHRPVSENTVICKPSQLMTKERRSILVISGTPDMICGLDDGIIASAKRYAEKSSPKFLYVMSERAFEKLEL